MMRMRFGLKALVCSLPFCLVMLSAAAAPPPLELSVDNNCQVVLPDFIENFETVFEGETPPWEPRIGPRTVPGTWCADTR